MTDNYSVDHVSRHSVLRTSAVATGTLVLGGAGVDTAAGTTQDGETFLELFAGPDRGSFILARGDALGLDEEAAQWPIWLPDTTLSGPEGILAFVPERLADEDGQVGLEDMMVMTSARALDGDLTTEATGALVPGPRWFPGSKWVPGQPPWWEPQEHIEAGASLTGLAEEELLLFGAAGHNFFDASTMVRHDDYWEELAEAETATVLELYG